MQPIISIIDFIGARK